MQSYFRNITRKGLSKKFKLSSKKLLKQSEGADIYEKAKI